MLAIVTSIAFGGLFATSANADEVGTDLPFSIVGNVKNEGVSLEGVRIVVSGGGYTAETVTDAEGKWYIGVPEKASYTVTLDQETLPAGIAVVDEGGAEQTVEIGPSGRVTKNFFIGQGERIVVSLFDQVVARVIYGLNFGLMLGLAAVGLSLVFGTTGLSNFAHAEMVTFGALAAFFLGGILALPIWIAIPVAVVISGLMGWGLDSGLWRPLRKRGLGLVQLMIVSIGLSLAVRYLFQFFIGGGTTQLPGFDAPKIKLFGATSLSVIDIASMVLSLVVIVGFAWWLMNTQTGKATRAISDNSDLAAASGIDVDRVVRTVWIVAAGLAGLAGVLWAYFRPGIKWDMGAQILLLIFAAVTLGGLGTAFGALLGALVVGLLVEVSSLVIPADLKYVGALVVLIVILLVRPQGILGRKERIG
ncbi:MAG: branched-chain amino acid ABC transporter permease [Actinobacteria bacterium]|jgi:branched-chain amino acid transport system permease protein|nr:branched-chain amino acid ABC transporter permease [Actinomycetota bacterium]